MNENNPTLKRLDEQVAWYDKKSGRNQRWFKGLKILEILAAAAIPLIAGLSEYIAQYASPLIITAFLGSAVVILESIQGLYQFQSNWTNYRSTCEDLRRERHLWEAGAGPYACTEEPDRLLAERAEAIMSSEHSRWISAQEKADKVKVPTQAPSKPEEKV